MRNSPRSGMGFFGILTLILIVLKVSDLITISWLWVIAPVFIPIGFFIIALCGFLVYYGYRRYTCRRDFVVIEKDDEFDTLIKESELPNDRE